MEIAVIGINHSTAAVDIREKFALPEEQTRRELLHHIFNEDILTEAVIVDTCNRTEVYFLAAREANHQAYLIDHIAKIKGKPRETDTTAFYRYDGIQAVIHLFKVAASLDSQIVGETEILGQVRRGYHEAVEAGTASFLLRKLFDWSFRVGKRVQTETDLGRGSASIAQAAVDLSRQIFSSLDGKTVMLVGAGENAELVARAVMRVGIGHLIVANRTTARAEDLAEALLKPRAAAGEEPCDLAAARTDQGKMNPDAAPLEHPPLSTRGIGLEELPAVIGQADLVISSTGSSELVLTGTELSTALRHASQPVFMVDIAVPRDIDPALGKLSNVYLYNIDDLNSIVTASLARRRKEIPKAEAILEHEVGRFCKWIEALEIAPTIRLLRHHVDQLMTDQIRRYGDQFPATDQDQLEKFARSLCNQILHNPLTFLRQVSGHHEAGNGLAAADAVHNIFGLDAIEAPAEDMPELPSEEE